MSAVAEQHTDVNLNKHCGIIEIDGSLIEGGGQSTVTRYSKTQIVLRNAAAYSCLLDVPVQIRNIRLNRRVPGLNEQQLCGLRLLSVVSGGQLEGGYIESQQILLRPGTNRHFGENVATASSGSACVLP
jgi:RNA 3'-terminal phosphate cyclase (ATP)